MRCEGARDRCQLGRLPGQGRRRNLLNTEVRNDAGQRDVCRGTIDATRGAPTGGVGGVVE